MSNFKNPLVSIIIPTHNRREMSMRLIDSILSNSYKEIEIIIIDDFSSDDTFEYLRSRFNESNIIKIIHNNVNLFTAASRNIGIKNSSGDLIFFVDDDNVLSKDTISYLARILIEDKSVGEVGPVNYSYFDKKKILWSRTKRNMLTSKTNQSRSTKEFGRLQYWETDDIPNAFMVRASIIKKYNIFFREKFEIMYEESDFAYRVRKIGYSVKVVKKAKIYHDVENKENGELVRDYMYHFMENKRRPYVTARNRILFHSLYSNKFEFLFIIFFWIWLFTIYYVYKIMFYSGVGNFSLKSRVELSLSYLEGSIDGIVNYRSLRV